MWKGTVLVIELEKREHSYLELLSSHFHLCVCFTYVGTQLCIHREGSKKVMRAGLKFSQFLGESLKLFMYYISRSVYSVHSLK